MVQQQQSKPNEEESDRFLNFLNCVKDQLEPHKQEQEEEKVRDSKQIENVNEASPSGNKTNRINKLTGNRLESEMFRLSELAESTLKTNENLLERFKNFNKLNNECIGEKNESNQEENLKESNKMEDYLKDCSTDGQHQVEEKNKLQNKVNDQLNSLKERLNLERKKEYRATIASIDKQVSADNTSNTSNTSNMDNTVNDLISKGRTSLTNELSATTKQEGELVKEKLNSLYESEEESEELEGKNLKNVKKQKINQSATYGKAEEKEIVEEETDNLSLDELKSSKSSTVNSKCFKSINQHSTMNCKLDLKQQPHLITNALNSNSHIDNSKQQDQQRLDQFKFNLLTNISSRTQATTGSTSLSKSLNTNQLLNTARNLTLNNNLTRASSLVYQTINSQPLDGQLGNRHASFSTNSTTSALNNNHKLEHKIELNGSDHKSNNCAQRKSTPMTFLDTVTNLSNLPIFSNENPILMKKINSTKRLRLSHSPNLSTNATQPNNSSYTSSLSSALNSTSNLSTNLLSNKNDPTDQSGILVLAY